MKQKGIYYDPVSRQAVPCDMVLMNGQLYLYLDNQQGGLRIVNLKNVVSTEWKGPALVLSTNGGMIECTGEIAQRVDRIMNGMIYEVSPKEKRFGSSHVFFFVLSLAIIGLGFLIYFYFLPWVAEKAVSLVPVDYEIKMGESLSAAYADEEGNDSANYFIQRFADELKLDDTYPIEVKVLRSEEVNAFAMPGGKIFVYSGLLEKMTSPEQLVALLGHEVTHVTHRHSLKSMSRSMASAILISMVFGDMGSWLISKADEFKQLDYSRELETEADNNGLRIMLENKVNPQGMLGLLELLKEMHAEEPGLMKYLSTHPDTESRIANIAGNPGMKKEFQMQPNLETTFKALKKTLSEGE